MAIALAFSVVCSAQAPKVIAQELCDRLDQANADGDLNRVFGFYDSSFVSTDPQGNVRHWQKCANGGSKNFLCSGT